MTIPTYTGRHLEVVTVESVHRDADGALTAVTWSNGWTFGGIPPEHHHEFREGREVLVETVQLTMVTGIATERDEWLWRKSDQQLDAEREALVDGFRREREVELAKNRDDWARREQQLPHALRRRLERFRANGGANFDAEGWGYELTVCELAVLYRDSHGVDDESLDTYARVNGTSGNQHDYAKALAQHLTDDPADADVVANSVSALAPLTGDADYSGAGR